jgi:flagellar hook protein FlgE
MFTGVSGLKGNSQALQVIGDNIANVNTVGFKGSDVVFGDILSTVLANGSTTMQFGCGTAVNAV